MKKIIGVLVIGLLLMLSLATVYGGGGIALYSTISTENGKAMHVSMDNRIVSIVTPKDTDASFNRIILRCKAINEKGSYFDVFDIPKEKYDKDIGADIFKVIRIQTNIPNSNVKEFSMGFKVPADEYKEDMKIAHIKDDGTQEILESTVSNFGKYYLLRFSTDSLSDFALIGNEITIVDKTDLYYNNESYTPEDVVESFEQPPVEEIPVEQPPVEEVPVEEKLVEKANKSNTVGIVVMLLIIVVVIIGLVIYSKKSKKPKTEDIQSEEQINEEINKIKNE